MTALAPLLQAFFTDRLIGQRRASPHTIAGYRDTFRLLLGFATERTGKTPTALDIADLDAPLIAAFLDHLERERAQQRCAPATTGWPRSTRCSATPRCTTPSTPPPSSGCWRSRPNATNATWSPTSPSPRSTRCSPPATGPPGPAGATTPCSSLAIQTGLRISELTGLTRADVTLGAGAHVHCLGKGRKERRTPLTALTVAVAARLAHRARPAPRRPAVPDQHRQPAQPRRHRTPPRPATSPPPAPACPSLRGQARHHAHAAAHRRHAPAARRQRHHRDRALARPRADRHRPTSTCTPT